MGATAEQTRPEGAADDRAEEVILELDGFEAAFAEIIGGEAPTTAKITLVGGAIEVRAPEGGFKKGSRYALRVEARVSSVEFTDKVDSKTQQVTGSTKTAKLRIEGASVL